MNPVSLLRTFAALGLGGALIASQGAPAPKTPQAAATSQTFNPAMKSRLFLVQYRPPSQMRGLLVPLTSGASGSDVEFVDRDGFRALSVRDFPENLAAIEDALKRLDVPEPARKQVEFHIHVLFASKQEGSGAGVPEELRDVLASLKATLSYRSYTPVAAFVQRGADGADAIEGGGQTEITVKGVKEESQALPVDISWGIYHFSLSAARDAAALNFPKFELRAWDIAGGAKRTCLASIETNLTMKDGEKVVVGTSMIRDKALIVVLTAKIVE
jgi:hypothetical protein